MSRVPVGTVAFAVVAAVVFVLDRVTKGLVNASVPYGGEVTAVPGLVWIDNTRNAGAAFGIAQSGTMLFLLASLLVAAGLAVYVVRPHAGGPLLDACLGLVFGGTLGNGYDRLVHGSVTDFIALHWWPVFNVADSAISVGVVALLAGYLLRRRAA